MDETCSVCYRDLNLENSVKTSCNHFFCSNCFFRWLTTNNTCAICRKDFCNREISREELNNYERDTIELLIKCEEVSLRSINLISENKELEYKKKILSETIKKYKELEKKQLELLTKMTNELEIYGKKIGEKRRELRLITIKKINLKGKKLRISGNLHF